MSGLVTLSWLLGGLLSGVAPATPVARVQTQQPVVALTFDACSTSKQANDFDREVFQILLREKLSATIFLSGRWIETHPEAARELAADPLLEFGNHTYDHPRMPLVSPQRAAEEIEQTDQLIGSLGRPAALFRPPAGDFTAAIVRMASRKHLRTILWDVVSGDAGGHLSPQTMIRTVMERSHPGSIIIFHINGRGPHTKEALPEIIAQLRARGITFVTVSELLALPDARVVVATPGMRVPRRHKGPTDAHSPG